MCIPWAIWSRIREKKPLLKGNFLKFAFIISIKKISNSKEVEQCLPFLQKFSDHDIKLLKNND